MPRLLKPKIVEDIKSRRSLTWRDTYRFLPERVNLSYQEVWHVPVHSVVRAAVITMAAAYLFLGSVVAPTTSTLAANTVGSAEERQQLEAQLKDLEGQINQYEDQIASYKKQGQSLNGEISKLNSQVAKINLQIKAVNLTLQQLDQKITDTQVQITDTESSIANDRQALGKLIRVMQESDRASLIQIFLEHPQLSDFFGNVNSLALVENNLKVTINQIADLQDQLKDQKTQFALARADAATVAAFRESQKQETDQLKAQKANLLLVTKGQESKYQDLLQKTKETAAQIRNRIFQLLGGGELSFEQAYEYAKLASGSTGVRPALILAVLDRESALGKNVGKCNYKDSMSPSDQPIFLALTAELKIDANSVAVSCANSDGAYGGAMGPAQFLPSTWNGYRAQIAKVTGDNPPSPWNNSDAFAATALYLRDAGAQKDERMAAAKYYCGSRWNRYVCTNVYGRRVLEQADQFEQDIQTIGQ